MGRGWYAAAAGVALAGCLSAPPASTDGDDGDDGGVADMDGALPACSAGKELFPLRAYNASPLDQSNACRIDGALADDGVEAGLDRFSSGPDSCAELDPTNADYGGCGCVGIDFGGLLPLASVTVRARWTPDACGYPCTTCSEGRMMAIFAGEEEGAYRFLGEVELFGDALAEYPVAIEQPTRFVAICRDWWGEDRADIAVESVHGTCE